MARDHARKARRFPPTCSRSWPRCSVRRSISDRNTTTAESGAPSIQMPDSELMPADAVILYFHVPYTRSCASSCKRTGLLRRPQMSHPIVNAGFRFRPQRAADWWNYGRSGRRLRRTGYHDLSASDQNGAIPFRQVDQRRDPAKGRWPKLRSRKCVGMHKFPARDRRGRNQQGIPASIGGELLLQVRPALLRWPLASRKLGCRGECVGRESS